MDIAGGPPITLCDAPNDPGGTRSRDGVIIFEAGYPAVLQKVSASGGMVGNSLPGSGCET